MAIDSFEDIFARSVGSKIELDIQGIELERVVMIRARSGRTHAQVTYRTISPFAPYRAVRQL